MAAAASSLVSGWSGWALTTTGQPAASALAVSPPGTLNANGKLEAAKTATAPSGTFQRRSSGRGGDGGRIRRVDDHAEEGAVVDDVREEPELVGDAGELTGEPRHAERGLRVGRGDQLRGA